MTWWDHDTGSVWSQPLGEAIAGPRKGETVELLPMTFTTWSAWRDANPDTLALDAPGGRTGFDLSQMYLVVDFTKEASAYPVTDVRQRGVVNDVVAGLEIAVVVDPRADQRWAVFSRRLDDRTVTLAVDGDVLVDEETGSTWDPLAGVGLSGELEGEILDRMPAITSFPGDYHTFWPEGDVWQP
jgi:hypothetical protein